MNRTRSILFVLLAAFVFLVSGIHFAFPQPDAPLVTDESTGDLTAVQQSILAAEYGIQAQDDSLAAYQAPNRAHGFRTFFTADGVQIVPRVASVNDWSLHMALSSVTDDHGVAALDTAVLTAVGNRVTYQRGSISEWYVNDSRGVEQGFTLAAPPNGAPTDAVTLTLDVTGELIARAPANSQYIEFVTADGAVAVRYADLVAFDASMNPLPAAMHLATAVDGQQSIQLTVATADAAFPILIDPVASSADWEAGIAQKDSSYGVSVSTAGDVNNDGFDDVIVGASWYDGGQVNEGAAFLYLGSANGLSKTIAWKAESNIANANFGESVDEAGDVNRDGYQDAIVGAPGADRAYVFHGNTNGLNATPNWSASGSANSAYGFAVSTAGDVNDDGFADVIVSAPDNPVDAQTVLGQVYVYYGSRSGLPATASWVAQSDMVNTAFGFSVNQAGDVNDDGVDDIIIGDPLYEADGVSGLAAVYHGVAGTGLKSGPVAEPFDADWLSYEFSPTDADYGFAVDSAGDVNGDQIGDVVVGAPSYDDGAGQSGAAYVYLGPLGPNDFGTEILLLGSQYDALFGFDVAGGGDVDQDGYDEVLVGAPDYSVVEGAPANAVSPAGLGSLEGSVFVFGGNADVGPSFYPLLWQIDGDVPVGAFGESVDTAGDVNGDKHADVLAGAPDYDDGVMGNGRAFAFYGTGPIAGLVANADAPTTLGDPTTFMATTDSPESGLNTYAWDFGDGNVGFGQTAVHTYASAGEYTVTVFASGPFNSASATMMVAVTQDVFIDPGTGSGAQFGDGQGNGTGVKVPAGATQGPIILSYTPLSTIEQPHPPNTLGYYFDLDVKEPDRIFLPLIVRGGGAATAADAAGTAVVPSSPLGGCPAGHYCFEKPVTLTITYNGDGLTLAEEMALNLVYWDTVTKQWIDAKTTCSPQSVYDYHPADDYFTIDVCHFSRFGVIGAN